MVHFCKFVIPETNMELGQLPSSRTKISEWKPFSSIRILVMFFSSFQIDQMINFCKHLQLNQNRRCFWYIVMLCKFISITGTRISPETDFPSAYCMFLFEGYNCNTHYSFNIGSFNFCGTPWPQPNLTSSKKTF